MKRFIIVLVIVLGFTHFVGAAPPVKPAPQVEVVNESLNVNVAQPVDVSVIDTPTVEVVNTDPMPVTIINGESSLSEPFQRSLNITMPTGQSSAVGSFAVPSDTRLVLKHFTAWAFLYSSSTLAEFHITTTVNGLTATHYFPLFKFSSGYDGGAGDYFYGGQQFRLYADPETSVDVYVERNGALTGNNTVKVSFTGFLEPMP